MPAPADASARSAAADAYLAGAAPDDTKAREEAAGPFPPTPPGDLDPTAIAENASALRSIFVALAHAGLTFAPFQVGAADVDAAAAAAADLIAPKVKNPLARMVIRVLGPVAGIVGKVLLSRIAPPGSTPAGSTSPIPVPLAAIDAPPSPGVGG